MRGMREMRGIVELLIMKNYLLIWAIAIVEQMRKWYREYKQRLGKELKRC